MVELSQALSSVAPQNFPIQCMSRLWFFLRPFWIVFLHFLKICAQVSITYYYCQVCVRPLWLAPNLLFVLFCPVFALSMYICVCFVCLYVFLYAYVCFCVFLCVFPLEWNISCCIYAIYCTFYRTYVLLLQYLALYGIICLQLNNGYVKVALICPYTIPFWYFFVFR